MEDKPNSASHESSTIRVPSTHSLEDMFTPDTGYLTPTHEKGVMFFFADSKTPIMIRDREVTTLGRRAEGFTPTLDLTGLKGKKLGVSRHHADIYREGKEYFIRDFNSTNGTWINNNRIPPEIKMPLRDGDHLRLGQLMMIVRIITGNSIPRNPDARVVIIRD